MRTRRRYWGRLRASRPASASPNASRRSSSPSVAPTIGERRVAVDALLVVESLVAPTSLVVSGGFMPPSILAVILGCPGLAEPLGRVGRLPIGPGGALVPSGGTLTLAPLPALVVALVVLGHLREPSLHGSGLVGAQLDAECSRRAAAVMRRGARPASR